MRDFGLAIRRSRELSALSQNRLAQMAGVSQATVSRLESGRGMSTPLLVVLRILSVLRVPLGALPADKVPGDLLMLVELGGTGWGATSATLEPGLVELVERYRSLKPVERSHFTNTAVALANAIVSVRSARRHHH